MGCKMGASNQPFLNATLDVLEQIRHGLLSGILIATSESSEGNSQRHCPV